MVGDDFKSSKLKRLPLEFYTQTDVVQIARDLLGMVLVTEFEGKRTSGRITETEAYRAPEDRASHAFGNRRTTRTETMFQTGGRTYIYLCYGIHHLFNVVTGPEDMAHAVLIRAIEPLEGLNIMQARRGRVSTPNQRTIHNPKKIDIRLTNGPGTLAQALGITSAFNGQSLLSSDGPIWIEASDSKILADEIASGPRIGVDYAGECASWPWRFWLKNSPFVKK